MPGNNPIIYGCMEKGGKIQHGELHAAADFDTDNHRRAYTHVQLHYLHNDYGDHHGVDLAMAEIPDHSLWAEVQHYHSLAQQYTEFAEKIKALENDQYVVGNEIRKSTRRLEDTNALQRIMDKEVTAIHAMTMERDLATRVNTLGVTGFKDT
ncbi:hypothetical protein EI94DRAFT_1802912 [Lactarius quietus]|nr:hypothetical protein EI94DRAFT_1802912 [Lactarius quietus]